MISFKKNFEDLRISSFQSHSRVRLFATSTDCSTPGSPVHQQLPEITQIHVHWVSDAIQPFHPLSSPSHPAFNLFHHQCLFKWVSSLHQVAKVLEFKLQHQSFQSTPRTDLLLGWTGWISLQSKGLSRVFSNTTVQSFNSSVLSFLHSPTLTSIALTRQTFVGKVTSLLLNMLSRLVITFLPRSKHLLISWLQSPSAVIFGAPSKIKCDSVSTVSPSISHEVMGPTGCHDFCFLNVEL